MSTEGELNSASTSQSNGTPRVRDDDEESALTNLEQVDVLSIQEGGQQLDLSEYYISSDADTEKLGSDAMVLPGEEKGHPQLAQLLKNIESDADADAEGKTAVQEQVPSGNDGAEGLISQDEETGRIETRDNKRELDELEERGSEVKKLRSEVVKEEEISVEVPESTVEPVELPEPTVEDVTGEVEATIEEGSGERSPPVVQTPEPPTIPRPILTDITVESAAEECLGRAGSVDVAERERAEEGEGQDLSNEDINSGSNSMDEEKPDVEDQRLEALTDITAIEHQFAQLRQKLYENKLFRLELELQMCMEGSHPELHGFYEKIASIRDYKLRRAYQRQRYELKCIDAETRASRTMIHQDFYKKCGDLKQELLSETTRQWYDINKERRDMDTVVPDVSYHVPVKISGATLGCITGYAAPAQRRLPGEPLREDIAAENVQFRYRNNPVDKLEVIVDRMRLNNELSDLEGLRKFYDSFPGAPSLSALRDSEIQDDMKAILERR
ncbi:Rpd3L histone deacetylase complex subunit DEP1 KNAG_0D04750 [Huiozyma naganishii CBS 8797]|uniref:Transcriptional regulatory protein DEP1 n=1 Tax=Huiozyma naganishii (strain ATCC MYA-139 / BCRC 22969 / CBS 8797 / KCTC 17520 / NBRC 10181 / NCYC 3082 / Yp74L-3) TaxID=1071383 RepID=J7R5T1_HUIN7|nr:hypothetical protein KNAG_0D04750 [Kazachstania naganishii CBS 8797]CCK70215.1 hypothetical protein KNAG_0D04750 [Kazachstania naganishii CBS 8797]